ncbi:hypothetical protein BKA56DRAFT_601242 [Ilyonectria sp. MPI-CAGE-AT-0026]|nr:hypothetical protein BKA56DRAFT_601242 [Ilyonectria sp. MPI-CAGE-AT-0026]
MRVGRQIALLTDFWSGALGSYDLIPTNTWRANEPGARLSLQREREIAAVQAKAGLVGLLEPPDSRRDKTGALRRLRQFRQWGRRAKPISSAPNKTGRPT